MLRRDDYRNKYHAHVVEIIYRWKPRVRKLTLIPHKTKKSRFNFIDRDRDSFHGRQDALAFYQFSIKIVICAHSNSETSKKLHKINKIKISSKNFFSIEHARNVLIKRSINKIQLSRCAQTRIICREVKQYYFISENLI